jgi:hypothetical protein
MKTAAEIGQAVLERLRAQAAANKAAGAALFADVRAVWEQHPTLTAKHVLKKLTRRPLPSVRRVQEILQSLRAQSSAPRSELDEHTNTQGNAQSD